MSMRAERTQEWTCPSCTLVNRMDTLSCGACRKAQPRGSAKKSPKRKATKRAAAAVATAATAIAMATTATTPSQSRSKASKAPAKRRPAPLAAAMETAGNGTGVNSAAMVRMQGRATLTANKTGGNTVREPAAPVAAVVSAPVLRRTGKVKATRNAVREFQAIERFISRQLSPQMK